MNKHAILLVVDNSPLNLELMRNLFGPFGYTVHTAGNVKDGLKLAYQVDPDLIISDVHMPGVDGYEFIRRAKADPRLHNIPFVFISSTIWQMKEPQKALELGAVKFIQRPIEPQQLLKEIEECLSQEIGRNRHEVK